jgi:hypothetical protein
MRKTLRYVGALLMSATLFNAQAQDSTAAEDKPKIVMSGYIDSYYLHAFNTPVSGNLLGYFSNPNAAAPALNGGGNGVGYARAFDRLDNQFSLGLVQTKFSYSDKKSDLVIDLTFGPNAELGNFGNQRGIVLGGVGNVSSYSPSNPNQSALYNTSASIKQAYFTYKATSKLSFTAGQFGTHVGYEVIDAPLNYNYSLSNLFNNGPFYHIGVKANYAFSDKVGLMVGLVNNWDNLTDWKTQKSTIAQLFLSPVSGWNIYINYVGGYNDDGFKAYSPNNPNTLYAPTYGGGFVRNLFDLTTGYQVTDKLYFGLNAAYGWYALTGSDVKASIDAVGASNYYNGSPHLGNYAPAWGGIALYSNYKFTDWLGFGVRFEHFDDSNGLRYINGINNALTLTAPITLADGRLTLKPEARFDNGGIGHGALLGNTYSGGLYQNGTSQSYQQASLGIAFIYKY